MLSKLTLMVLAWHKFLGKTSQVAYFTWVLSPSFLHSVFSLLLPSPPSSEKQTKNIICSPRSYTLSYYITTICLHICKICNFLWRQGWWVYSRQNVQHQLPCYAQSVQWLRWEYLSECTKGCVFTLLRSLQKTGNVPRLLGCSSERDHTKIWITGLE